MYIMDDGIRLDAVWDMPEGIQLVHVGSGGSGLRLYGKPDYKLPVCIIIHGFTGWKEERHLEAVAKGLNSIGMAVLRVDMYGHGHSEGEFRDHTLYKWLSNITRVVDYARSISFVSDIWLCGHSQGGLAVILAGAMLQDRIKGMIPMSAAIQIPQLIRDGWFFGTDITSGIPDEITVPGKGLKLSGNYARVARTLHVEEAMESFKKPVLLVHGDADAAVPVHYSEEADECFENSTCVIIQGDTHGFDYHLDLAVDAITEWMKEQL